MLTFYAPDAVMYTHTPYSTYTSWLDDRWWMVDGGWVFCVCIEYLLLELVRCMYVVLIYGSLYISIRRLTIRSTYGVTGV